MANKEEDLDRIEIEKIPASAYAALQVYEINKKERQVCTAAVRIIVVGVDGTVISDTWTRDRFWNFFRAANLLIADD